ncbi:MAG TPA: FAD-dependent oxidoreductase [Actinomycetota bacterium]
MPDVVVIGGGIIGVACARELARGGASVTLLEKDELAAGASGRNLGYLDTSKDPVLAPPARAGLGIYLEVADAAAFPVFLDRDPIGTLAVTLDEDELDGLREWIDAAVAVGVPVERVEPAELARLEPALSPAVIEAWLLREGHRVDPTALTVAMAADAREHGATVRHHVAARRLIVWSDRVTGVMTDDGPISADVTVLAAGPWSASLLRPAGVPVPVAGARGWLVQVAPARPTITRWIQAGARRLPGREGPIEAPVPLRAFAGGARTTEVLPFLQPAPDGTVIAGTSREPSLAADAVEVDVPRAVAEQAARLVPELADASVLSTWSGVRPVSPDERPLIGSVLDGLVLASGHGSEGVILAGGTGRLVRALVLGEEPPFDPAPFDPVRSGRG